MVERKIKFKNPAVTKIIDISKKPKKVSPEVFASALGAEIVGGKINNKTSPFSLIAIRQELYAIKKTDL